MADTSRSLSYKVQVDAQSAQQAARSVKQAFEKELKRLDVDTGGAGGGWMPSADLGDLPGRLKAAASEAGRLRGEYAAMGSVGQAATGGLLGNLGAIATGAGAAGLAIGALSGAWALGVAALEHDAGGAKTSVDELSEAFEGLKLAIGRAMAPTVDNVARGLTIVTSRLAGDERAAIVAELEALERASYDVIPGAQGVSSELGNLNWQAEAAAERTAELRARLAELDGMRVDAKITVSTEWLGALAGQSVPGAAKDYYESSLPPGDARYWAQLANTQAVKEQQAALKEKPFSWDAALRGQSFGGGYADYYKSFLPAGTERGWAELTEKNLLDQQEAGIADWRRAIDAAEAAQERATRKAETDWERAADRMADAFESALREVPGLFSPSRVTGEDMALAAAGLYQPKADEYLRRLKDEVYNGVDYAGVDIGEAASRAGLPAGADPKGLYLRLEQMWNSGELFSNPENIPYFMDPNVVQGWLAQQQAGQAGQQNLLNYFGMGSGAAPQFAMTGKGGLPGAALPLAAGPAGDQLALPALNMALPAGTGRQLLAGLQAELEGEEARQMLDTISQTLVSGIAAGWQANIAATPWAAQLEAGILADIVEYFEGQA